MFNQPLNYFEESNFIGLSNEDTRQKINFSETSEIINWENKTGTDEGRNFKRQEDNFTELPIIKDICADIFTEEFSKNSTDHYFDKCDVQLINNPISNNVTNEYYVPTGYTNQTDKIAKDNKNYYYENWGKSFGYSEEYPQCSVNNTFNNVNYYNYDNSFLMQNYAENTYNNANSCQLESQLSYLIGQPECSNDGSDIIVEDTTAVLQFNNVFEEKKILLKCLICNIANHTIGFQFYQINLKSPLTMTSQKPVINKLRQFIKTFSSNSCICNECLGLINSMDYLETKLKGFQNELINKISAWRKTKQSKKKKISKITSFIMSKKLNCKYCKKTISLKDFYKIHMKKHKSSSLCEICGRLFFKKKNLMLHMKYHEKNKNIPNRCTNCGKSFLTKSNFKMHQNFCLGLYPFKCKVEKCDKKFTSCTKLKSHVKLKHDKKFMAICSICNIGFIKLSDYKSHMITHSTDKKFHCQKCDKSYKTLSNLNFHMKSHQKILPFICEICKKGFMRKEYLEVHLNNHKGIRNFKCNLCPKAFASQKNLDSHLKFHDGSIQKTMCTICGKSVLNIEEHNRIHNNLQEFECSHCDFKFNTKGTLLKHQKMKHKNC